LDQSQPALIPASYIYELPAPASELSWPMPRRLYRAYIEQGQVTIFLALWKSILYTAWLPALD